MKKFFKRIFFDSSNGKVKLNEKAVIFFLCLVLATFFWYLSSLSKTYTTTFQFPIKYSKVSEDLVLTEAPQDKLFLFLTGSGFDLLGEQISINKEALFIDFAKSHSFNQTGRYYILTSSLRESIENQISGSLDIIDISPDTLFFQTLPRTKKEIPVYVNGKITFKKQITSSGDLIVNPSKVMISGPKNYIDTVSKIFTDSLLLSNVSDTVVKKLGLKFPDDVVGVQAEPSQVEVIVPAEKFTEGSIVVPIQIKGTTDTSQLKIFPDDVKLTFLVPLSKFEFINEEMFVVEVEADKQNLKKKKLEVNISHSPGFIDIVRIEPERVEFIIRK